MKNSFNIEGAIIDLTRHNYNSKNKIKEFKSINEAIEIINEIYNRSEVTLNELLSSIIINNCFYLMKYCFDKSFNLCFSTLTYLLV